MKTKYRIVEEVPGQWYVQRRELLGWRNVRACFFNYLEAFDFLNQMKENKEKWPKVVYEDEF